MREKLIYDDVSGKFFRITPASAGKTILVEQMREVVWDHPRECGKNKMKDFKIGKQSGSPPRVREKPLSVTHVHCKNGITPASAGKTTKNTVDFPPTVGSPPRVREKLKLGLNNSSFLRITPASAGKTLHQR